MDKALKRLLTTLALGGVLCAGAQAQATTWWAYVAGSDSCELGAKLARAKHMPAIKSPGDVADFFRASGITPDTHIYRDDDNAIYAVAITIGSGDDAFTVTYFPTSALCETFKALVEQSGMAASPSELH